MTIAFSPRKLMLIAVPVIGFALFLLYLYGAFIWQSAHHFFSLISDREEIRKYIASFGWAAPFLFMGIQILQVIFAPVPGEATGFVGGYLFGVYQGFLFSSIALSIGSWINFNIGRFCGERFVRHWIPAATFERLDRVVKRQGIIVILLLFIFPGFPKDYFCIFLGLSTLPLKVFIIMATFGRMPGTFVLSLQGASLYTKDYILFAAVSGICLLFAFLTYRYRERLYLWVEKLNHK